MAVTAEHRALHHAIDDLRAATSSLQSAYGDVPAVARLRNDLERLILDVADADALPPPAAGSSSSSGSASASASAFQSAAVEDGPDDAYAAASWDDVDDEGVGGFRGPATKSRR